MTFYFEEDIVLEVAAGRNIKGLQMSGERPKAVTITIEEVEKILTGGNPVQYVMDLYRALTPKGYVQLLPC